VYAVAELPHASGSFGVAALSSKFNRADKIEPRHFQ
jgi:hypothetical protein